MMRILPELTSFGVSGDSVYSVAMRRNTIGLLTLAMLLCAAQTTRAKVALELKTITLGVGEAVRRQP